MNKKLQVFVSSTYTDLIEERQAVVQAILDAGHIPAGMELFKAGNESQLKTIYKWIDESDVYMLILGGRYGTIEEKSGKSYTQLEYEYALSKNIPIFAVVLSDSFLTQKITSLGLKNATEQIAPDKYQTFKTLVMSKVIRKVDDYKDIKIAICLSLNDLINEYNFTGWIRDDSKNHELRKKICTNQVKTLQKLISQLEDIEININNITSFINGNTESFNTLGLVAYASAIHEHAAKNICELKELLSENKFEMQKYENDIKKILTILEDLSFQMLNLYQFHDLYKGADISILNVLLLNIDSIKNLLFNLLNLCKTDFSHY